MITERFEDPGQFTIPLDPDRTPVGRVIEQVAEFDHLVVMPQHFGHPIEFADADLLAAARYAGVVLEIVRSADQLEIQGQSLVWHLGDADGIGPLLEDARVFSGSSITDVFSDTGLLPAATAIAAGNIVTTGVGSYTATHQWETPLEALRTYSQTRQVHWRVNPNGTIDACATDEPDVYVIDPVAVLVRTGWGSDPRWSGLASRQATTRRDGKDWIDRAVLLDQDSDGSLTLAASRNAEGSYYDFGGGILKRTLPIVGRPSDGGSLTLFLDGEIRSRPVRDFHEVDGEQFDLAAGRIHVGDWVYVFDPPGGFFDPANEVHFRGQTIWPKRARVIEASWPVATGMGVYARKWDGDLAAAVWLDLTPWVAWEYQEQQTWSRLVISANEGEPDVPS